MSAGADPEPEDLSLYVNFPVSEAIRLAPADAEQAAVVLRLAAALMRRRQSLPHELADYLAGAFESSMAKPQESRVQELAHELHLKARNRRPAKAGWIDAYSVMQENPGMRQSDLARAIVGRFGVSMSTAKRLLEEARNAELESRRADAENSCDD